MERPRRREKNIREGNPLIIEHYLGINLGNNLIAPLEPSQDWLGYVLLPNFEMIERFKKIKRAAFSLDELIFRRLAESMCLIIIGDYRREKVILNAQLETSGDFKRFVVRMTIDKGKVSRVLINHPANLIIDNPQFNDSHLSLALALDHRQRSLHLVVDY